MYSKIQLAKTLVFKNTDNLKLKTVTYHYI